MTHSGEQGFTILEALVALVLMAVAAASFYRAVDFGARGTRLADHEVRALTVARNELIAAAQRGMDGPSRLSGVSKDGIAWTAIRTPLAGKLSATSVYAGQVDVQIEWRDVPGQPVRSLTLTTLLAEPRMP